ncbi:MAG: PQQ-binding-like beta-propeller repeat protein [Phycisphaeraceae bacterium]
MTLWHALHGWVAVTALWATLALGQATAVYPPEDHDAEDLIAQTLDEADRGAWETAARLVHRIVINHPDGLVKIDDGRYQRAPEVVWSGVGAKPELRLAYQSLFSQQARRELQNLRVLPESVTKLIQITDRYRATPAGIDAGLLLVALHLEAARLGPAALVLDRLDRDARRPEQHQRIQALRDILNTLRQAQPEPKRSQHLASGSVVLGPPPETLGRAESASLWTVPWRELVDEQTNTIFDPRQVGQGGFAINRMNQTAFPQPLLTGGQVLVNTGGALVGLDRFSGGVLWRHDLDPPDDTSQQLARMHAIMVLSESRGVATDGTRAFAIVGVGRQASRIGQRGNPRSNNNASRLLAVDLQHGDPLWEQHPDSLGDNTHDWHFVGTPVTRQGFLYAVLQRIQGRSLAETNVACFAADTGDLLWRSSVGTVAVSQPVASPGAPQLAMDPLAERLVLIDPAGLIVALHPTDGGIAWALDLLEATQQQTNPTPNPRQRFPAFLPGFNPQATWLNAGLIVQASGLAQAILLSPTDGRTLRTIKDIDPTALWAPNPQGGALVLNDPVTVLNQNAEIIDRWPLAADRPQPQDQHQGLWFIRGSGLWWLDPTAGRSVLWTDATPSFRLAANDEQLIIARPQGISAFMAWPVARDRLAQAVEQDPNDPESGIRLAEVAAGQNDAQTLVRGLAAAATSLDTWHDQANPADIQRLTTRLFSLAQRPAAQQPRAAQTLLDLLAELTTTPAQRSMVTLLTARAHQRAEEPLAAVDSYQQLLLTQELASASLPWLPGEPLAAQIAAHELRALVEDQRAEADAPGGVGVIGAGMVGGGVYAEYDERALVELQAARDRDDPRALARIVERYPASRWSRVALELAGQLSLRLNQPLEATLHLRRAYRLAENDEQATAAVRELLEAYRLLGLPEQRRSWVRRLERDHPGTSVVLLDDPNDLITARPRSAVNWTGLPNRAWTTPTTSITPDPASSTVVTLKHNQLELWRQPDNATAPKRLHRESYQAGPIVATADKRSVLVTEAATWTITCFDAITGQQLWRREPPAAQADNETANRGVINLLEGDHRMLNAQVLLQAQAADAIRPLGVQTLLVRDLTDFRVIVSDQRGRILALDRANGSTSWTHAINLGALQTLKANEWVVAMVGQQPSEEGQLRSRIVLLDTLTGEHMVPMLEPDEIVVDLALSDVDVMATIEGTTLVVRRVEDAQPLWQINHENTSFQRPLWIDGRFLAVQDNRAQLHVYDALTGQQLLKLPTILRPNTSATPITAVGDKAIVRWNDRLLAINAQGKTLWEAAPLANDYRYQAHWLTTDRVLTWLQPVQPAVIPPQPAWAEYDLDTGRLLRQQTLPANWRQADLDQSGPTARGFVLNLRNLGTAFFATPPTLAPPTAPVGFENLRQGRTTSPPPRPLPITRPR